MKTALVTTTINVPTVLELYRQHGPDVAFFVAGDVKTPHDDLEALGQRLNTGARWYQHEKTPLDALNKFRIDTFHYYDVERQKSLGYKCSELIGWSNIQRRNIALLEAIKWGADVVVSCDDDNIPLDNQYYFDFQRRLWYPEQDHCGIKVSSPTGWFDVGQLLDPISPHRGMPIGRGANPEYEHVVQARVGVAAGICLGDPDISAVNRISQAPTVHRVSELLNSGIVVDPGTKTVWNSQNTALIRELLPAWGMVPFIQRYDDILASLVCGRVMRERGLHVHFGRPYVYQQRNSHNLIKDLRGEIEGMDIIENFAFMLDETKLQGKSVIDDCRTLWKMIDKSMLLPEKSVEAMLAYVDDCEGLGL